MGSKKWKVDMKDIRNLLALVAKGSYSNREIATSLGISHQSVSRQLDRLAEAGVSIQEACDLDDEALSAICYPNSPGPKSNGKVMPNLDAILTELAKPNPPTRKVLYDEYCEQFLDEHYGYSQFCEFIRQAKKDRSLTMHLEHVPGDQLLIDFAGDKVGIYSSPGAVDPDYQASIFVATLAFSGKTFIWATRYQDVSCVIDATERALYFFGGVVGRLVPDNMAAAVTTAKGPKTALKLNNSFKEFANHLGTLIAPTRVRRPKDKAKVEQMVGYVQRDILGRLRNQRFYSIAELNVALLDGINRLNNTKIGGQDFSREDRFVEFEANCLAPLPPHKFQFGVWSNVRAGSNYHVKVAGNYYSVPYRLANSSLSAKATIDTIEIYEGSNCVAIHTRSMLSGKYTTIEAHMPQNHLNYQRSTSIDGLLSQLSAIGPSTLAFAQAILDRAGPATGLAIGSLAQIAEVAKLYGADPCEQSCTYAIAIGSTKSSSLRSIAAKGLFDSEIGETSNLPCITTHDNIRGACYYGGMEDVI